ncbi:MAG: hypothetical protein IJK97_11525 [Thermoguttaceae bacterium]|nr:hypothetical protein [Thermoguttaceae bacterium]MBR0190672.1 hypothetical protein [Thermoguttaceae bacterium]
MKRIKDFLHAALLLAAVLFFCGAVTVVFFRAFGPYLATCFDFLEDWTIEEKAWLGDAIRNPY